MRKWGKKTGLGLLLTVLIFVAGFTFSAKDAQAAKMGSAVVKVKNEYSKSFEVLTIINKKRAAQKLPPLKMDKALLNTAMQRAAELTLYFSHDRPNGETCFSIFPSDYIMGENIAAGQSTSSQVMNSWMNSPGHKANIMNPDYKVVGVGVVSLNGVRYWVQCFGGQVRQSVSKSSYGDKTVSAVIPFDRRYAKPKLSYASKTVKAGQKLAAKLTFDNDFSSYFGKVTGTPKQIRFVSSNKKICTVNSNGTITGVKPGKATIYMMSGSSKAASVTITVAKSGKSEVIKKTAVSSLKAGKKSFVVKWKKQKSIAGYQIQYSTDKGFRKGNKTITIKNAGTYKKTVTRLKSKKKYYVRVRTYKNVKVKGKTTKKYSGWSGVKAVKVN
ncbi:MAG: Ig-like domain-containing protein [Lachnospiraceae bacterium]|nr:Ig-like domain-containing protein [Lachnospiraceae bacterium]